jgi:DNA ligase-1
MIKLRTLYKEDSVGKLREWTMVINDNSYHAVKGLMDGKKTTDQPRVVVGKNIGRANATTNEEQAQLEAKSRWDKKLKAGYAETLEGARLKKFYEPMLAQKFEDREATLEYPVYSQPKLDGIRCIVQKKNGKIVSHTRTGREIETIPHVLEELKYFFEIYPNAILDGELYNHALKSDFNKIVSLVRKQVPVRSEKQTDNAFAKKVQAFEGRMVEAKAMIQYWIYDCPRIGKLDESNTFSERFDEFRLRFAPHRPDSSVVLVPTENISDKETLDEFYAEWLKKGFEGQMVRKNAPYENKRSATLLKRKEFTDAEYKVLDIEEGDGNRTGTVKHLVCYCPTTDRTFNSNVKGNFEYLKEVLDNREYYIGQLATIKFFELTPDGIPRFPFAIAFRDYE